MRVVSAARTQIDRARACATPDDGASRASERVNLACQALTAAVRDLRVAHKQSGYTAVDDAADSVAAETERVCELSEELVKLATNLRRTAAVAGRDD